MAQLAGQLEERARAPVQQQAPVAAGPDPTELLRQANEALDAGKHAEYQRLSHQAAVVAARNEIRGEMQNELNTLRQQMPTQVNPAIQFLMSQHKNVALAGERGARAVMLKDQELELYGMPRFRRGSHGCRAFAQWRRCGRRRRVHAECPAAGSGQGRQNVVRGICQVEQSTKILSRSLQIVTSTALTVLAFFETLTV